MVAPEGEWCRSGVCPSPEHAASDHSKPWTIPRPGQEGPRMLKPGLHALLPELLMAGRPGTAAARRCRGFARCRASASERCPQGCPRRRAPRAAAAAPRQAAASVLVMGWQRLRRLKPPVKELWLRLGVRLGMRLGTRLGARLRRLGKAERSRAQRRGATRSIFSRRRRWRHSSSCIPAGLKWRPA